MRAEWLEWVGLGLVTYLETMDILDDMLQLLIHHSMRFHGRQAVELL